MLFKFGLLSVSCGNHFQPVSMASPCQCASIESNLCNRFLLSIAKTPHPTYVKCHDCICNSSNPHEICNEWDKDHWNRFEKFGREAEIKWTKKQEHWQARTFKSISCFSGFSSWNSFASLPLASLDSSSSVSHHVPLLLIYAEVQRVGLEPSVGPFGKGTVKVVGTVAAEWFSFDSVVVVIWLFMAFSYRGIA